MSKEIIHSLILIFAIVLGFVYPRTSLSQYDLQISAGLFVVLYSIKKYVIKSGSSSRLLESVIFTLIILGIINTTGGLQSPFFFLIYFLLFSLSLLLEPVISITTTLALIIFFLLGLPPSQDFKTVLPIISLGFITPFAMYMGQETVKNERLKEKNAKTQEDTFLFMSLMIKNHLRTIKEAVDNFMGDQQLGIIKKSVSRMEKLIEKYEKSS